MHAYCYKPHNQIDEDSSHRNNKFESLIENKNFLRIILNV